VGGKKCSSFGEALLTLNDVVNVTTDMAKNFAPVFTPIAKITTNEGAPVKFNISAVDIEAQPVVYSVDTNTLPIGASFDPASAEFNWTPADGQFGWYPITFRAHDEYAYSTMTVDVFVESDKIVKLSGEVFGRIQEADEITNPPQNAFDDDVNTYYYGQIGSYAGIKLDKPYYLLGFGYIVGRNHNYRILYNEIQGSVDGKNWDTLDMILENPPGWSRGGTPPPLKQIWFKLAERPKKAYTYYRIYAGIGPHSNPGTLELYGVSASTSK